MNFRRPKSVVRREIDPDEIFLDSKNLPGFDVHQFEGRIEKPVSIGSIAALSAVFLLMLCVLLGKAWVLQAKDGAEYGQLSENNTLKETTIYANRGAIFDRNGVKLAWNSYDGTNTDFAVRSYIDTPGFSHILGYIKYPTKDKQGNYYRKDYQGMAGVEKAFDDLLGGDHGLKIVQTDAVGKVESESVVRPAVDGQNLTLSIDSVIQQKLFEGIKSLADRVGFTGGAGVIMDVHTGEVIALTSYPEYSSQIMSDGSDSKAISGFLNDSRKPFLDRIISGLYTPGSIVKPYVAIGALEEKVIDPKKEILSTGSISIPNPYYPNIKSVFMDWRPQGYVDMRKAIAVSSDVYFYEVGGGFQDQPGLGIDRLNKYFRMFHLGSNDETGFFAGPNGTIPSPSWKDKVFPGDPWRIGDTYFTAIGQYGFLVTPLQMIKALTTIANGGTYIHPTIFKAASSTPATGEKIPVDPNDFEIIREGMREGAIMGTASGLNVPYIDIAAKTGTAQLGVSKAFVNSWVSGFFPYENPKYAFVVMMEHGPSKNVFGATFVMRGLFDWMHQTDSSYLKQ
ncbi:MAG TPA: penicillin-binding transpeptidase domain-containing protein [Candidatus Paceibacterota bacterium]|nr:penicillin-binding transpeptidase domain-containing protein [Candidatus Paceibacterota bacterium]